MLSHDLKRNRFGDPADAGRVLSPVEAMELLNEWVANDRLRLHMRQVARLMKCWAAEREGLPAAEQRKWEQAGLLHDADWEKHPDDHCRIIIEELERRHVDPDVIHAIASHGPAFFGVEPESRMDKMLYAFDELSGLIHAYSLMRPGQYDGMQVKGVKKRLKEKSFAANVSRDDIHDACRRAGVEPDDLIAFIIANQPGAA